MPDDRWEIQLPGDLCPVLGDRCPVSEGPCSLTGAQWLVTSLWWPVPGVLCLVLLFVALWFILQGDLLYVFPCVILFSSCVFSPFSIAITSLGEERANLGAFHTFVWFVLVWICRFPLPLGSGRGCSLWLWHSLDFSLTFFSDGWPVTAAWCPVTDDCRFWNGTRCVKRLS